VDLLRADLGLGVLAISTPFRRNFRAVRSRVLLEGVPAELVICDLANLRGLKGACSRSLHPPLHTTVFIAARKAVAVSFDMPEKEGEEANKEPMTNVAERIASTVVKALLNVLSVPLFAETPCNGVSTSTNTKGLLTSSSTSLPQHVDANGYTSELVRLLQRRDSYKAMASHAGTAIKISIFTKAWDDTNSSSSTMEPSFTNKRRNSLFNNHDQIIYNHLGETKVQHDSLLSQMDHAKAWHHQECQAAEVELQSCHDRRETIASKKAELEELQRGFETKSTDQVNVRMSIRWLVTDDTNTIKAGCIEHVTIFQWPLSTDEAKCAGT
jgi:hypothetical protein